MTSYSLLEAGLLPLQDIVEVGWGGGALYAPKSWLGLSFLLFVLTSETIADGPTELVVVVPAQTARTAVLGAATCAAATFVVVLRKRFKAGGRLPPS